MANELEQLVLKKAQSWLDGHYDEATKKQVKYLMDNDMKELVESFYKDLEFGTGGLRGIMGVGSNRMNVYTVGAATQGLSNYLKKNFAGERVRVAVAHDSRNNSRMFAEHVADIFASNGFQVFLFDALRPTPELSFAIRELKCHSGVVVTASHNPKEYNGYKVYWSDGAQLPPQHADAIAAQLEKIDIFTGVKRMDFDEAVKAGLIEIMGEETDRAFMKEVMAMVNDRESMSKVADTFKVVYTPFHGCGWKLVPEALRGLGVKHLYCVEQQMVLDGSFPTVASPNPENPEGFYLAIELADKVGADFILGTDPDSDRVGIMVRDHAGKFVAVTGNQTGVLLLDYLIGALRRAGKMPEKPVFLKSIVTTNMARTVAEANGVTCCDTFTGFKFMAEKKAELESSGQGEVILSYEESYGYMMGDYVRDKDAVTASLIITEMAGWYAAQGMTLFDALGTLYEKYGYYKNALCNFAFEGEDGMKKMNSIMDHLRHNAPAEIAGFKVVGDSDYQLSVRTEGAEKTEITLPKSNVLEYRLENGSKLIVRPSGTEPKIKIYLSGKGKTAAESDEIIAKMEKAATELLGL